MIKLQYLRDQLAILFGRAKTVVIGLLCLKTWNQKNNFLVILSPTETELVTPIDSFENDVVRPISLNLPLTPSPIELQLNQLLHLQISSKIGRFKKSKFEYFGRIVSKIIKLKKYV
jgi:hypothetical protein